MESFHSILCAEFKTWNLGIYVAVLQIALSKDELVSQIQQLQAHVTQLKNIIARDRAEGKAKERRKQQRPFDFTKYNTRHVALKIAYLGWDYHGFAVQEDTDKTIEAALFDALIKTRLIESRATSCYHRCGRTDKGVSALGQVISIDLRTNLLEGVGVKVRENGTAHLRPGDKVTEIRYVHILNKVLPPELRVLAWTPVDPEFSARFSCLQRMYKYMFPRGDADIQLMNEAAGKLIGEHDYRNLCKMDVGNGVVNYIRRIISTQVKPLDSRLDGYQMCELTVVGQAFLWHQIRCIVAVLLLIGQGKERVEIIDELLDVERNPRKPQYTMASEIPLILYDCDYEGLNWHYETDCHEETIKHLQTLWTEQTVKSTMLKRMLDYLEKVKITESQPDGTVREQPWQQYKTVQHQCSSLVPGNKPRTYKPLLEREVCESLEDRINHYVKRRKIEIKTLPAEMGTEESEDS
ncbi:tRNA pseudouridine(38/39) synthase isoform X2 [Lingula anatina]|uniref:tRNA pseudouridine(38/39) synthase isoform X2 n=1 Tax=Lingula anatina TaxID=7574 RepID=A0A1S3JIJ6_LINAN|nr:tRNA pseudouridine(38/39) synthase isoform X2 [Lingula anatina]|eukprot:XP_013409956.1 tRNA pseudouridine(38/39) synthase isoform X2 [Lingula anatina]